MNMNSMSVATPLNKDTTKSLSSLLEPYGVCPKWIYYELNEKGEKQKPCGRKHNWTKNECSNKAIYYTEKDGKQRCCRMEFDISNTPIAIFDCDKKGRSYEETIQEYPFLKGAYYQCGNTKGFHFFIMNDEFINSKKVIDELNKRDLITDVIWCKDDRLNGEKIISVDIMEIKNQFPKFNTGKDEVVKVIKEKTNNDVGNIIIDKSNKEEFIEELLNNIDIKYCENFQDWFNIVGSLKSINQHSYIDFFSMKSSYQYKQGNYDGIVKNIKSSKYTIGTLYHYSKLSNSFNHYNILDKFNKIPIKAYEELGDTDYADIFINISDDIFYHSTRECFFGYNPIKCIWEEKKKESMLAITTDKLLDYLNKELRRVYLKMSKLDVCTNIEKTCKCDICSTKEKSEDQIKQMGKNIKSCKSATNTKHIIDYIFDKLKNRGVDIPMDANPYLFCWDNKTYDIKNRNFVKRDKYDYITTTTGYDYEEPAEEYKGEIQSLMGDIFSNKEVEKCFFSICRSGLTGVLEEKFTLANGSGGNGKGLINFGMSKLLGNYFHDVSHSVLTKEITGDKPLPEISKLNGVRYCVISEIKEDSILLEDSIKKLTNPIINARGMYSSQTRVINTATYVAECNARPKIQGENGDAMSRRYIDVLFNKKYTSDPDKLKLDGYLQANPLYKTEDYWNPRRTAFFFWLLKYDEIIYEPPVVKARSKEFLNECNVPLTVFEDKIEKCEFNKTRETLISVSQFLDIVRKSEEFKYLEKQEKKLYSKNKILDFFRNNFFNDYKKIQRIGNSTCNSCLIGYRVKKEEVEYIEED